MLQSSTAVQKYIIKVYMLVDDDDDDETKDKHWNKQILYYFYHTFFTFPLAFYITLPNLLHCIITHT